MRQQKVYFRGEWSGGWISLDRNSTFSGGWHFDHEVEIPNNDLISWSQHFSWDQNCLIMLYFEFWSHDQFVSHKNDHEIKIQKALLGILTSWSFC